MKMFELEDKTIVIFGFGREGRATFEVLSTKLENAKFIVTDEKSQNIPEYMSPEEAVLNSGSETIVIKSPGISPSNKFVQGFLKNGAVISSATNIFFAERKGRGTMIGITGSKGKSTTASLLAHVLRVCGKQVELVGNIGEPAILHIDDAEDTIFVIELSSYQLSDLLVGPDVAVALNIFDEHMDYHGGSEGYVNAKLNITKSQTKEDIFFYHPNYEELVNAAQNTKAYTEAFPEVKDLIRGHLPLLGEHNIENARAVFAVTRKLNIDDSDVQVAMESFKPLAHRLEEIGEVNGILFVNDSISTTPESAIAAVNVYADRLGAIILGGEDRGYKFDALADRLSEIGDVFVYIMPGGERICESMTRHNISYIPISTIDEAVKLAAGALSEGSVCLLSPASPSYNQFKNFEERGHAFRLAVQNLA